MVWGDRLSETGFENEFGPVFASEGSAELLASGIHGIERHPS